MLEAAFGHWFAGFFDGEGSLGIYPGYGERTGFRCTAKISLRADDRPILEEIAATLGIGRVYDDKKGRRNGSNPCSAWIVEGREACAVLVAVLERYPLRAKKQRDFAIWADAVRAWCSSPAGRVRRGGWDNMARLAEQLRSGREFVHVA